MKWERLTRLTIAVRNQLCSSRDYEWSLIHALQESRNVSLDLVLVPGKLRADLSSLALALSSESRKGVSEEHIDKR